MKMGMEVVGKRVQKMEDSHAIPRFKLIILNYFLPLLKGKIKFSVLGIMMALKLPSNGIPMIMKIYRKYH